MIIINDNAVQYPAHQFDELDIQADIHLWQMNASYDRRIVWSHEQIIFFGLFVIKQRKPKKT